jgi:hypothetical protein
MKSNIDDMKASDFNWLMAIYAEVIKNTENMTKNERDEILCDAIPKSLALGNMLSYWQ